MRALLGGVVGSRLRTRRRRLRTPSAHGGAGAGNGTDRNRACRHAPADIGRHPEHAPRFSIRLPPINDALSGSLPSTSSGVPTSSLRSSVLDELDRAARRQSRSARLAHLARPRSRGTMGVGAAPGLVAGSPFRSARSTARASATRDETPSLRKMLRRCVSTVFLLGNSSAAILGLVLRLRRAAPPAARVSLATRGRSVGPAWPRAPMGPMTELSGLAFRLVAVAERAARVELGRRAPKLAISPIALAGLGGLDPRACAESAPWMGLRRPERHQPKACARSVARALPRSDQGGGGPIGPGGSEGKPHGSCRRLGKRGGALGLAAAIQRQPTPCEQLEAVRPPTAGDECQLLTTARPRSSSTARSGCPGLEQDTAAAAAPGRDEAVVEVARELDRLLCGSEREVEIADGSVRRERLKRFPARAGRIPSRRPASMAPSRSSAASAHLPRTYQILGRGWTKAEQGIPSRSCASEPVGTSRVRVALASEGER